MATTKGKASTPPVFKSKSKATTGRKFIAMTLLIEETGQAQGRRQVRSAATAKKPLILEYCETYLKQGHSYGFGDWAVKSAELTEEQFQLAYEQL